MKCLYQKISCLPSQYLSMPWVAWGVPWPLWSSCIPQLCLTTPMAPLGSVQCDDLEDKTTTNMSSQFKRRQSQSYKFKECVKFQIFEFWYKPYTWHTFWSCFTRCVNMKWIRQILLKIQCGHNSVHRQTDGQTNRQGETSIPPFQLCWSRGYNKASVPNFCPSASFGGGLGLFFSISFLWFEIQDRRTDNFFDWVLNTDKA